MHVVTTAMCDSDYVFGGHDLLVDVLKKAVDRFSPGPWASWAPAPA